MTVPARVGLTRRQLDYLTFIKAYIAQHGIAPTYSEIAMAMNTRTKGRIHEVLTALMERGHIIFKARTTRSIVVVPDAGSLYGLPSELQRRLSDHCAANGEDPAAVVADAVALHLDELGERYNAADAA